jgi:hypothetical protein
MGTTPDEQLMKGRCEARRRVEKRGTVGPPADGAELSL